MDLDFNNQKEYSSEELISMFSKGSTINAKPIENGYINFVAPKGYKKSQYAKGVCFTSSDYTHVICVLIGSDTPVLDEKVTDYFLTMDKVEQLLS